MPRPTDEELRAMARGETIASVPTWEQLAIMAEELLERRKVMFTAKMQDVCDRLEGVLREDRDCLTGEEIVEMEAGAAELRARTTIPPGEEVYHAPSGITVRNANRFPVEIEMDDSGRIQVLNACAPEKIVLHGVTSKFKDPKP